VDAMAKSLGRPMPLEYREFLLRYGGAVVGASPIYGIRQSQSGMGRARRTVLDLNERWQRSGWPHSGEWLIVSEDQSGNPVGIASDGRVLAWDHDTGQTIEMGSSFEDFLRRQIASAKEDL
jgi:hypothetical protein